MIKRNFLLMLILPCFACLSNEGGTEIGNSTRNVIGTSTTDIETNNISFQESSVSLSYFKSAGKPPPPPPGNIDLDSCGVDQILAIDSQGNQSNADLDEDCNFTLALTTNKAYSIILFREGQNFGPMRFQNGSGVLETSIFYVSSGSDPINLGTITINNNQGFPSIEPSTQNDQDGDGIPDFLDDDDDNDGLPDIDEGDCDFDGFWNDFDEDFDCEENSEGIGFIEEIFPFFDDSDIPINETIELRTDCAINFATVNSNTFNIRDESNNPISCNYSLFDDDILICEPQSNLSTNTTYTVRVEGLKCEDNTLIEILSWSFTTQD